MNSPDPTRRSMALDAVVFVGVSLAARVASIALMPAATHSVDDLALGPVALAMGVIYALAAEGVTEHVLRYCSLGGWFGIAGLLPRGGRGTAALLLVMIPALGPGYWSQYVQWSLPLLVAVFAAYDVG